MNMYAVQMRNYTAISANLHSGQNNVLCCKKRRKKPLYIILRLLSSTFINNNINNVIYRSAMNL